LPSLLQALRVLRQHQKIAQKHKLINFLNP
jgi:hypothetical protein